MTRFEAANLIRLFDFYLAAMFLIGLSRRYAVYWEVVRLLVRFRGRYPAVAARLRDHRGVLLTGTVVRPLLLAAGLMLVQMGCSRLIWPRAQFTVADAVAAGWPVPVLAAAALPMLAVDLYFVVRVGRFDRAETERGLDQAEHWLATWKAPVIRAVTLGYLNPHRIVDTELRKNLTYLGETVGWASWWAAVQVGCRTACGLAVWAAWAAVR